jgi:CRP-like cAMP-binding protein
MDVSTLPTNLLLSSLSSNARAALLKHATTVQLPVRTVLFVEDSQPRHIYFLLSGLASVITIMPNGESADVGFIGREGLVGSLHLLGSASLSIRSIMQLPGSALRVPFTDVQQCLGDCAEVRSKILQFQQQQSAVVAQIAGCCRLHHAEQRLIRCLLTAQDLTGYDTLNFTQDYLAQMIGTQRSTVSIIAGNLQRCGLIGYSRGRVRIQNRAGLEAAACACTRTIRCLFNRLYQANSPAMLQSPRPLVGAPNQSISA